MYRFERVPGLMLEPVAHLWAAFSPLTGETSLLNDESVAILETLQDGAMTSYEVCIGLASDSGIPAQTLAEVVEECWPRLVEAGYVRKLPADVSTGTR